MLSASAGGDLARPVTLPARWPCPRQPAPMLSLLGRW